MGMDGVELVMATEEEFGIQISDGEAAKVATPRQLIELVREKAPRISRHEIAAWVKEFVIDLLGVPPEKYSEDGDFVKDFGLD